MRKCFIFSKSSPKPQPGSPYYRFLKPELPYVLLAKVPTSEGLPLGGLPSEGLPPEGLPPEGLPPKVLSSESPPPKVHLSKFHTISTRYPEVIWKAFRAYCRLGSHCSTLGMHFGLRTSGAAGFNSPKTMLLFAVEAPCWY